VRDTPATTTARDAEQGAVIVEFAAVFIVFAMLLGGLISYGMIFAVQQSLEHGTSEAARSAVGVFDQGSAETRVRDTLDEQLEWLGGVGDTPGEGVWIEEMDWSACDGSCLRLRVGYEGALLSLMPFQIATPDRLGASATLDHDLVDDGDEDDE
jgi:hypothetical protein